MASAEVEIENKVRGFVAELTELIQRRTREAAMEALGGALPVGRGRKAGAVSSRPKGEKRSPAALAKLTDQLASYIQKNPGQRIEQIGKALKTPTKDFALPIRKLIADKKIRSKGQKRATTYLPAS